MSSQSKHINLKKLIKKLQSSKVSEKVAQIETQIISYITSSQGQKLVEDLNDLCMQVSDSSFCHIFKYLIKDSDFISDNYEQIIIFLKDNLVLCGNGLQSLSFQKRELITQMLLNININESSLITFADCLIQKYCRSDLTFCYAYLWNVNQILEQYKISQLSRFNMNSIVQLAIRIIKNFNKLPLHLVDQSLRFMTQYFFPISLRKIKQNKIEQVLSIVTIVNVLVKFVKQILKNENYKSGYAFKFIGFYLGNLNLLGAQYIQIQIQQLKQIFFNCQQRIKQLFPNFKQNELNILQNQIQKTQQHYKSQIQNNQSEQMKINQNNNQKQLIDNQQKSKSSIITSRIQLNLRINLLQGVSSYLTNFFIFIIDQSKVMYEQLKDMIKSQIVSSYVPIFELLAACNDKQIFCNFIKVTQLQQKLKQLYGLEFRFTEEFIIKQIIRNCPEPVILKQQSKQLSTQQQHIAHIIQCLSHKIHTLIKQNKLQQLLSLIKDKIQKQYDQSFNTRQFQSACNALTLIFRNISSAQKHLISLQSSEKQVNSLSGGDKSNKKTLTKEQILEWIKMLINLSQSCLQKHQKSIITKIYQLLTQIFQIILPGNQYLQQVIQNELITKSFPQRQQFLQRLICFYEQKGGKFFELGYRNKIAIARFSSQMFLINNNNEALIQQEENQSNNGGNNKIVSSQHTAKQKRVQVSNEYFRKNKLVDRVLKKLQQPQISFKDRITLWKIVLRVYAMKSSQKGKMNVSDLEKVFQNSLQLASAKYAALYTFNCEQDNSFNLLKNDNRLKSLIKKLQIYPQYYSQELFMINSIFQEINQ